MHTNGLIYNCFFNNLFLFLEPDSTCIEHIRGKLKKKYIYIELWGNTQKSGFLQSFLQIYSSIVFFLKTVIIKGTCNKRLKKYDINKNTIY